MVASCARYGFLWATQTLVLFRLLLSKATQDLQFLQNKPGSFWGGAGSDWEGQGLPRGLCTRVVGKGQAAQDLGWPASQD